MDKTIIDMMSKIAVEHNGLFIPGRLVEDLFSKYCTALGYWTDNDEWPVVIPGSATLIKYRGRYMMACTRHQLSLLEDPEGICIILPENGKSRCITSGGSISFINEMNDGDHNEIALFDFTEPAMAEPDLRPNFLDFRGQHPSFPADHVVGVITYGYPFEGREIDYEGGKLGLVKRKVVCKYEGQGSDDAVHIIKPVVPLTFSPDGISGGPAFAIIMNESGFSIHLVF